MREEGPAQVYFQFFYMIFGSKSIYTRGKRTNPQKAEAADEDSRKVGEKKKRKTGYSMNPYFFLPL